MDQSARLAWYHDHAIGITRTNAYSGIASALIITDAFESSLITGGYLPDLVGVPLVLQDNTFFDPTKDPHYPVAGAKAGDLWYPYLYEQNFTPTGGPPPTGATPNASGRWDYGPTFGFGLNPPDPTQNAILPNAVQGPLSQFYTLPSPASLVPEYFSDTAMINGAPYPVINVTDKTFRFRALNGSQARFWHLNLYLEDPATPERRWLVTPARPCFR